MSQPEDFGPHGHDPLAVPLNRFDQLLEIFYSAEKKAQNRLLGIEYEMFAHDLEHNRPLSYEGPTSISQLFLHLAQKSALTTDPFIPVMEDQNIVALSCQRATIALEPGGQIEIAAKPHATLEDVNKIFLDVVNNLQQAAQDLDIKLFAVGIHPLAQQNDMAQVKKSRYKIMRSYMKSMPGLGLDMMKRSCSIQLNLDYKNQEDFVLKTRFASRLVPFLSLLCSSAAFIDGQASPYAIPRGHIWQKTDPDRTGIPSIIFDPNFGYESWINWALDVPMYFIRRGKNYINVAGCSFRDFMAHGLKGEQATVRDFLDHLSTIFTEVRLKPYIEIRSPDSLPASYVCALSTLVWTLFYDEHAFNQVFSTLESLDHPQLIKLHQEIIQHGRTSLWQGIPVLATIGTIIEYAKNQLKLTSSSHNHHENYLQPFEQIISSNMTVADVVKTKFAAIDKQNILAIIDMLDVTKRTVY
ncbi:MAG: hypothetical protein H6731_08790 [Myxococcales bacterium]|nr:MAG: hypothetical protein H6731_08790 [Myxococcales bacterium]